MNAPFHPAQAGLDALTYLSGFGNGFETEALPGALPQGHNSPQRCAYGLYAEQLSGSPFTAPRASNQRSWLYRIQPSVKHLGRYRRADAAAVAHRAVRRKRFAGRRRCAGARCRCPAERLTLIEGMRTITTAGDANGRTGMAAHVFVATRQHGRCLFLQCRRRNAVRARTGRAAVPHRIRRDRRGARRHRGHSARGEVRRRPEGRARRAAMCARITAARSPCRSAGRSARIAWPIQRDFKTPVAAYEDRARRLHADGEMGRRAVGDGACALAAGRGGLARQLRALQIRSAAFFAGRPAAVRPCGSVDFHGADRADRHAGHGERGFRDFSGSLDGGGKHVPAALVSHEPHERVHGPDLRRLRRQAAGFRAGRLSACTIACCRTGRTWTRSRRRALRS